MALYKSVYYSYYYYYYYYYYNGEILRSVEYDNARKLTVRDEKKTLQALAIKSTTQWAYNTINTTNLSYLVSPPTTTIGPETTRRLITQ